MSTVDPVPSPPRALWYVAPGRAELRPIETREPRPGEVGVRTLWSAISRGTERLVAAGTVPAGERDRMRAPAQVGDFPFPVMYGYAAVGVVEAGEPSLLGRTVFALQPHRSHFVAPAGAVLVVPDGVPARRAVLAANAETALNALWDAPALPGMRIAVVGGGVVGALCAWLAGRLPGTDVVLVDVREDRAELAEALGVRFAPPTAAPTDCDLVVHASASEAGLATAISAAGDEATVLELSWYGERAPRVPLGGAFHAGRLRLVGSQVGRVAPAMRSRWTHRRRLAMALALLDDPRLDALLAPDVPLDALPAALPTLLAGDAGGPPCPVIRHRP